MMPLQRDQSIDPKATDCYVYAVEQVSCIVCFCFAEAAVWLIGDA